MQGHLARPARLQCPSPTPSHRLRLHSHFPRRGGLLPPASTPRPPYPPHRYPTAQQPHRPLPVPHHPPSTAAVAATAAAAADPEPPAASPDPPEDPSHTPLLTPEEAAALTDAYYAAALPSPTASPPSPLLPFDASDADRAALAAEWGYARLGRPFPSGTTTAVLTRALPPAAHAYAPLALPLALLKGLAVYLTAAALALSPALPLPLLLLPPLYLLMGTAYAGLFHLAANCAHFAALPSAHPLQDFLGAALMAPALYPFVTYRAQFLSHVLRTNTLDYDARFWRPTTLADYRALPRLAATLHRLAQGTPLKLLSSLGHWARSFDAFNLRPYYKDNRGGFLAGWIPPALFVGFALPELLIALGPAGVWHVWLAPLLVFHAWASLLSLVAHRGPHIPWRRHGPEWDEGQAVVSGSVTLRLPRAVEWLLNDANYSLPHHISIYIPWYNLRATYSALQSTLGAYLTEATLNLRLLRNLITRWQLYDEEQQTYVPFPTEILTNEDRAEIQAGLDRVVSPEAREQLQGQVDRLVTEETRAAAREAAAKLQQGVGQLLTDENRARAQEAVGKLQEAVGRLGQQAGGGGAVGGGGEGGGSRPPAGGQARPQGA